MNDIFKTRLGVINLGLSSFTDSIRRTGGKAVQVDWAPPAGGDAATGMKLAGLINMDRVEEANREAFERYLSSHPVLKSVGLAIEKVPGMEERMILHAGPPVSWDKMCGPMKGAILGAIIYEGWADNLNAAQKLAFSGEIKFSPCHHHCAVGPMAGVISPNMPVWEVENTAGGNSAFSNMNEGLGKVLRFGSNNPDVIERLKWMKEVLASVMKSTLSILEGLALKPLIAQALHMGDEVHNRNVAATSLFLRRVLPSLLKTGAGSSDILRVSEFISANDHFFLNISMAACKAMLDAAHGIPCSSMVTAMSRNGVEFGIRVSGTGDVWFTAPAPSVEGLFFPGYTRDDSAPDLGDSTITETAGIGGFAAAAAPAIVQFVGGTQSDAVNYTKQMGHITIGSNAAFTVPSLDFAGIPAGIDVRKVTDTGILPIINTGIAHKNPGVGQVGAGVTHAPLACFSQAVVRLSELIDAEIQAHLE